MKVRDDKGEELDASFAVELTDSGPTIVYESRGGTRGKKTQRNADYAPGLDLLLARLKARGAVINQVRLHQKGEAVGELLAPKQFPVPIRLEDTDDVVSLRKALGAVAAKTSRTPKAIASGSTGNNTKRIRIYVGNIDGADPTQLEHDLAAPASGGAPVNEPPDPQRALEVLAALNDAEGKKGAGGGQGYGLSKPERDAVEALAMKKATEHFAGLGWTVTDVSKKESFDLECTRGAEKLRVEVKGTTGKGNKILLTKNEVAHARKRFPSIALYVLSEIKLMKGKPPACSGGKAQLYLPWKLEDAALVAVGFEYRLK